VFVFAGVGRPQGFADLLADHGANVVATRWFRDHHRYEPGEAAALVTAASARDAVAVTTAKDAVKLPPGCAAWVVEVAVEPLAGSWDGLWERCPELAGDGVR
jgi:tetraacyldisaccharide 4'-kinase